MADKLLRIGGRGEDGTAKPIKTDNAGNVGIQLVRGKEQISTYSDAVTVNPSSEFVLLSKIEKTNFQSIIVNVRWALDSFTKYTVKVNYYNEYDLIIFTETFDEFDSGMGVAGFSLKHPKFEVVIRNNSESAQSLKRFSVVGSLADSIENKKMSLLAKNTATGKNTPLSAVQDATGESVLRVVDAAPFAYDSLNDLLKIKISGNATSKMKEYLSNTALLTSNAINMGETALSSSSSVVPLDVTNVKSLSFFVNNKYDQTITIKVRLFSTTTAGGIILSQDILGGQTLNAGQSKIYTPSEFHALKDMVNVGLCIMLERGTTAPSSGSADVIIFGKAV